MIFKPVFKYLQAFIYAFDGLKYTITHHKSFHIEVLLGIVAIELGVIFSITVTEWLILIVLISNVLAMELMNTAIEATLDYFVKEHHISVKTAKDVAAGAVLLVSIASLVIGSIIFVPYLMPYIRIFF
jgi:undecaprenol kinase